MGVQIMKSQLVQKSLFNNFVAHQKRFEPHVLASPPHGARQMSVDINRRCIPAVPSNVGNVEFVANPNSSMKRGNHIRQDEVADIFRAMTDLVN
ncbi:hypothetical protein SAMN03159463_05036 [Mesorhizobium sp. NFR06]|nr:hypothetical protein SAMN03159463_05036 [Mesorhizobium sp. NFR06]